MGDEQPKSSTQKMSRLQNTSPSIYETATIASTCGCTSKLNPPLTAAAVLFSVLAFSMSIFWKDMLPRLPWGLDSMWLALAFYALGQVVREKEIFTHPQAGFAVRYFYYFCHIALLCSRT